MEFAHSPRLRDKLNTVYPVGKPIFDRGCRVEVGALMLKHGGGGHGPAVTCQGDNAAAESLKAQLIGEIRSLSRGPVREEALA